MRYKQIKTNLENLYSLCNSKKIVIYRKINNPIGHEIIYNIKDPSYFQIDDNEIVLDITADRKTVFNRINYDHVTKAVRFSLSHIDSSLRVLIYEI